MPRGVLQRLANEADRFRGATERYKDSRERLHKLIREAAEEGIPSPQIVRASGLNRQRVHQILGEKP